MVVIETMIANSSAIGTASQMPSTPISSGRISKAAIKNTNVLKKDSIADTLPLENAVNILEEKIFIPVNK